MNARVLSWLVLPFLLVGCAAMGKTLAGYSAIPGYGVDAETAERLECDYARIQAQKDSVLAVLQERRDAGETGTIYALPSRGVDHCGVLAHLGLPSNYVQSQKWGSTMWVYRPPPRYSRYQPRNPTIYVHLEESGHGTGLLVEDVTLTQ